MKRLIFFVLTVCMFFNLGRSQDHPVHITLVEFYTVFDKPNQHVDVHRETGSESNVSHFNIWRSTNSTSYGTKVVSFVLADGPGTYDVTDSPSESGRYYYTLEEVDNSNNSVYKQPYPPETYDPFVDVILNSDPVSDTETISGNGWYDFNEGGSSGDAPGDGHAVKVEIQKGDDGTLTVTQNNQAPADAPGADVAPYHWEFSGDIFNTVRIYFYYNDEDVAGFAENSDYIGIAQYNPGSNSWNWVGGTVHSSGNYIEVSGVTPTGTFALYRRIFGDVNGNGYVDGVDLQRFGDVWQQTSGFTTGSDPSFFNYNKNMSGGNQIIDGVDLQVFGDCWHNGGNY
ncbi:MAG: hypothetical protein U5R06_04185 [candidate division KSB1 bacterium]|nr:hypothetical protein [candidate division KSB1 bacterium]